MAKKNINPAIIIVALIVIFAFYKSGFLGSFITTCNNVEPDSAAGFKALLGDNMNLTTEQAVSAISMKTSDNVTYSFNGEAYTNGLLSISVYDTSPINCESLIDYILQGYADKVNDTFQSTLVRPDYNSSMTYYLNNNGTYAALTAPPALGQEYYKLVVDDYVKMTTPYMSTPPSLKDNPYDFYTPIGYKTISGKLIENTLYWCSNNQNTLLLTNVKPYETMNAYGPAVIQCATQYVNDTQVIMDKCISDGGLWQEAGICKCPGNQSYTEGTPCQVTTTGNQQTTTTTTSEVTPVGESTSNQKIEHNTTNLIIGIGLIVLVIAYFVYNQFIKKKHGKKRKLF